MKTETIQIHFDGGCRPSNPGNKYGSWEVLLNGKYLMSARRVEFGFGTNNEAEFQALIQALNRCEACSKFAEISSLGRYGLEIFTDSTIVANRLAGRNKTRKTEPQQRMARLTESCLAVAGQFKGFVVTWNSRTANVKRFGH